MWDQVTRDATPLEAGLRAGEAGPAPAETDPAPPPNDHYKKCFEEYLQIRGGHFAEPEELATNLSLAEAHLWKGHPVITHRVTQNPRFHQANTEEVMRSAGISFPTMDRARVFTLLDYAVARQWGQSSKRSHR